MSSGSLPFVAYHRASHLGDGSYGSVVTVYNNDGEEFALKLFLPVDDDDADADADEPQPINLGVLREISCLRLLRGANKHANIIELQDVQAGWSEDEDGGGAGTSGCLGIAMPLGKLGSLAGAIAKRTFAGYPRAAKVQLAHGLLSAVAFLHDNGILHRDIKCDNVLLEHNAATNAWQSILIDFSLAKPIDGTMWNDPSRDEELEFLQHTGEVCTLVYTAPEIVSQVGYGKPADLYSVGVVLLELLQNEMFTAEKAREAAAQIATAVEKLPDAAPFPDLIRRLLEPDPDDRITARQALEHDVFAKFGWTALPERRIVDIATALPYDGTDDDDDLGENESPNHPIKTPATAKIRNTKLERRLKTIDKFLHDLNSEHPWTRWAALDYSQQLEQLDDEMDDIRHSQSLADCCVLAHRFFELDMLDLPDLEERNVGPFARWNLDEYLDNEATIFMTLDYCLYPRSLALE